MRRQVDRIYRLAYRMAYPVVSRWWRLYGHHHGVAIAVWSGDTVLAVRHSYKPGLRLPGGALARRENPHEAAVRELREEVGVTIDPARLRFVAEVSTRVGLIHLYETRVEVKPDLVIDRREIVEAHFVHPIQLHEAHFRNRIGAYLRTSCDCSGRACEREARADSGPNADAIGPVHQ
jgi:8-oxo-dGTP diphosphatase